MRLSKVSRDKSDDSKESDISSLDSDEDACCILNPHDGKDLNFQC